MGAVAEAKKHNWKMSVSVADPAGFLLAHATMDGTQYASIAISQAKASHRRAVPPPEQGCSEDGINGATGPGTPGTLSLLASAVAPRPKEDFPSS